MTATYLIAGGGTGGHIFPAVGIGEALMARVQDCRIIFVGTRYGMEKDLIPKLGYTLKTLPVRGWLGKGVTNRLALLWRLPASLILSFWLILRYRPKVVIGVGGYASAPLLFVAGLMRKPVMIQEQNAVPGVTNKLVARFAKLACCGFAEAAQHLICPALATGNPVRRDFLKARDKHHGRDTILILGGSQGARALNEILPGLLKKAVTKGSTMRVIHQCGRNHQESVSQAYEGAHFPVTVSPFIDNMAEVMGQARLVICRAGASTISELKLARVPAVLVPYPLATHNHQTFNAKSLAACGAAILIPESDLASDEKIGAILNDPERLNNMEAAYPGTVIDSADLCARVALDLQKKRPVKEILAAYADAGSKASEAS